MRIVFLVHLFSTLFMNGLIWSAQAVHHPLPGPYHNLLVKEFNLAVWHSLARTN